MSELIDPPFSAQNPEVSTTSALFYGKCAPPIRYARNMSCSGTELPGRLRSWLRPKTNCCSLYNRSVEDYILRIQKYSHCTPAAFLYAIVYMDRLVDRYGVIFAPNMLNVHRILLTGTRS